MSCLQLPFPIDIGIEVICSMSASIIYGYNQSNQQMLSVELDLHKSIDDAGYPRYKFASKLHIQYTSNRQWL